MKTRDLKTLAEESSDEYEEYIAECRKAGLDCLNIWMWIAEQIATEEEYRNDMLRDDALMDAENVS